MADGSCLRDFSVPLMFITQWNTMLLSCMVPSVRCFDALLVHEIQRHRSPDLVSPLEKRRGSSRGEEAGPGSSGLCRGPLPDGFLHPAQSAPACRPQVS